MVEVLFACPTPYLVHFTASVCPHLQTGMSASVPLIANPRDQFLDALPFVHARARNQCINAIRRAFDYTRMEQKSVQVMLHLSTQNGPTLMEMIASVVRGQSELCVIFTGGEVDSSLIGLLYAEGPVTGSAVPLSKSSDDDHLRPISEGLLHAEGSVTGSAVPLSESNDGDHFRQDGCETNLTVDERDSMTSLSTNPQEHHNDDDEIESKMSSLTILSSGSVGSAAREINFMLGFTSGMG